MRVASYTLFSSIRLHTNCPCAKEHTHTQTFMHKAKPKIHRSETMINNDFMHLDFQQSPPAVLELSLRVCSIPLTISETYYNSHFPFPHSTELAHKKRPRFSVHLSICLSAYVYRIFVLVFMCVCKCCWVSRRKRGGKGECLLLFVSEITACFIFAVGPQKRAWDRCTLQLGKKENETGREWERETIHKHTHKPKRKQTFIINGAGFKNLMPSYLPQDTRIHIYIHLNSNLIVVVVHLYVYRWRSGCAAPCD